MTYADQAEILNLTDKADDILIFVAEWTANSYTVKFDANTGTGTMIDQTFTYDVEQTLTPNAFDKAGYKFAGWNTEANGSGTLYLNGDEVKNIAGENDSVTLYATWVVESNAILIEFDTGDGASEQLPQYVERGSKLKRPSNPTKTGYTFIGWFNGENEYDFDAPVTAPLKLTAKWVANTYTVDFGGSGEDDGVMEPMTFTYDVPKKLEKNAYTKENHHFVGWRLVGGSATIVTFATDEPEEELIADEAEVMNLTAEQNGQVSLEAVWAADTFNITYRNVEGATNNNPNTYTFGEGIDELQAAYKANATFEGWYTTADFSGTPVTSISKEQTGDITLYAKWTENGSDNPFGPGGNPLTPSWISKLLAGTGDVMPYVASALALLVAFAGGLTLVTIRRRKSTTSEVHGAHIG